MFPSNLAKLLPIVILIVGIGPGVACAQDSELEIITYGDSITAGLIRVSGVITCPPGVTYDEFPGFPVLVCFGYGAEGVGGYQPTLKQSLQELGYTVSVYNWGYSGNITQVMAAEIDSHLNAKPNSDYFIVLGGANDAFNGVSASTVKFYIQSMVNDICEKSMIPVISSPTYRLDSANDYILMYKTVIEQISTSSSPQCSSRSIDVILADQYNAVYGLGDDGLHLNSTGNIEMANEWLRALALPPIFSPGSIMGSLMLLLLDD